MKQCKLRSLSLSLQKFEETQKERRKNEGGKEKKKRKKKGKKEEYIFHGYRIQTMEKIHGLQSRRKYMGGK